MFISSVKVLLYYKLSTFCKVESIIDRNSLELTRSILSSSPRARPCYVHLIKQYVSVEMVGHSDLISRVKLPCKKYGISFLIYIFDDSYSRVVRNNFTKGCAVQDDLTESVRLLLGNNNAQNKILLNLVLRTF